MKEVLGFVLRAGISVGILAVILAKTDLSKMGATFTSISGETVAFVAALTLLQTAIGAAGALCRAGQRCGRPLSTSLREVGKMIEHAISARLDRLGSAF